MILYNSAISGNCYKVRLLLAHLGVEYETREVEVVDRAAPRDELRDLNPALRVPTLVLDDGRPLAESNAILWYFGDGTPWVPADRYERAQVLQWLFFEQYEHEPAIAVARFLVAYSQLPRERYERRLPQLQAQGVKALAAMDRHLAAREWLVGGVRVRVERDVGDRRRSVDEPFAACEVTFHRAERLRAAGLQVR